MSSVREAIYGRLVAILTETGCFDTVIRNEFVEDADRGRIGMIFDGDEEPMANTGEGRGRPLPQFPRPTHLRPEVYILTDYAIKAADIGPWLTWAVEKVKHAFLTDSALLSLLYNRDPILYEGSVTGMNSGRSLAGEVSMRFTLTFVDRYEDPGAEPEPTPDDATEPP